MNRKILSLLFALVCPLLAKAADVPIFPTGAVFRFQNTLIWGSSAANGFNNNFFFTPISLNENVCVYVQNNNPTNTHTFAEVIKVTANPSNKTPSDGTWQNAATSSFSAPISTGQAVQLSVNVSGVAQVSINFSGSITQAGNPDTAQVILIQTQGTCFGGAAPPLGSIAAIPPALANNDSLGQAFFVYGEAINPAANAYLLFVDVNSAAKAMYPNRILISCTANCSVTIGFTSNVGACTPLGSGSGLKIVGPGATFQTSAMTVYNIATCNHSEGENVITVDVAANSPQFIDLAALAPIDASGSTGGVEIHMAAAVAAGTVRAGYFWYER